MTEGQPILEPSGPQGPAITPILTLLLDRAEAVTLGHARSGGDRNLYEVYFKTLIPEEDAAILFRLCKNHMVSAEIHPIEGGDKT